MIRWFAIAFVATLALLYAPWVVAGVAAIYLIRHYPRKA